MSVQKSYDDSTARECDFSSLVMMHRQCKMVMTALRWVMSMVGYNDYDSLKVSDFGVRIAV